MYQSESRDLASVMARETFVNSFPFPEKFMFCTDTIDSTEWQDLAQRQRNGDCSKIHLPRCGYQVTKLFCSRYCFTNASSVRALVVLVRKHTSQFRSSGK